MKSILLIAAVVVICGLVLGASEQAHHFTGAVGGDNDYNRGRAPEDWWGEIERMHGHVGPWNVLGWRIGKVALREFAVEWGRHELDVICYVPVKTPYTCMADGLAIGTGNSLGRLDLRLAEVVSLDLIHVCIRRKDRAGPILIVRPRLSCLRRIDAPKPEELEKLSRECSDMEEGDLFTIERIAASKTRN